MPVVWMSEMESSLASDNDVHINVQFLSRVCPEARSHKPIMDPDLAVLNEELDRFISGEQPVVGIDSIMASGKTYLQYSLIREQARTCFEERVGFITHRTALALNMLSERMRDLGFKVYLGDQGDLPHHPRVICQLDSVLKLCQRSERGGLLIPSFDLLVLDESESLLAHCTSSTLGSKQPLVFKAFCAIIKAAKRVMLLDAFMGAETRAFMACLDRPLRVIRNTRAPSRPRTYIFTNCQEEWMQRIVKARSAGENVAVASLSALELHRLKEYLIQNAGCAEEDMLLIESRTDEEVKRHAAQHCNEDFTVPLLLYSPAVGAGLDFTTEWFDHLLLYLCPTATPMDLMQMSGRIRSLKHADVHCLCCRVAADQTVEPYTPAHAMDQLRWQESLPWRRDDLNFSYEPVWRQQVDQAGQIELVPPAEDDPALVVASHNLSRLVNARRRFLPEFIRLVEEGQHHWAFGTWQCGRQKQLLPKGISQASILLSAPVVTEQEANQLMLKQVMGSASRDEKLALDRHYYCRPWGIHSANLDHAFLKQHGCEPGAPSLRVLLAMLSTSRGQARLCDDPSEMQQPVVAPAKVLAELLGALGIPNVLDSSCNTCSLTPEVLAALKRCEAFRKDSMARVEQVFGLSESKQSKSAGRIAARIATLFKKAGLACEVTSQRRQARKQKLPREYSVSFDTASTCVMAELLKHRYHGRTSWCSQQVAEYLGGLVMQHILKYIAVEAKPEEPAAPRPPRKPRQPDPKQQQLTTLWPATAA